MRPFTRQLSLWLPLGLYIALIFFFSSRSLPQAASIAPDFVLHGLEYMVLGAFMVRALNGGLRNPAVPRMMSWSLLACVALAVLDELLQRTAPNRVSSLADLVADGFGAVVGIVLVRAVQSILFRSAPAERG